MTPKLALMLQAKARAGDEKLLRCGTKATLWDGFICERGRLMFYWNDRAGNTHMVWAPMSGALAS
jgi:hypothetical protein